MDTLTVIIVVVMLLVLIAPIIEIAVKRPKTFLEMTADARAFAEAPPDEDLATRSSAGQPKVADERANVDRLASFTP